MKDIRERVSSVGAGVLCAATQQRERRRCEENIDGVHNRKDIDGHQDPGNNGVQRVSISVAFVLFFKLPILSLSNF
jgi:hypothetical protein